VANPALPTLLGDLHLLTVLAQTRSYTQAARQLGVSKGSVSTRISALEAAAGVPLVRRTTRSVVLTQAGLSLVEGTQAPFAAIAQAFSQVHDLAGQPRGLVRMTAPVALGRQWVGPLVNTFLRLHPEVRVELDLNDRLVNLTQEGFDLAIRHSHTAPDTHVAWELCSTRSLLVASADYLQRRGRPRVPADLVAHDCLLYLRDGPAQRWAFERSTGRGRGMQQAVPVQGPLKVNNSEVLRQAVVDGLGIGLLPDFSLAHTGSALPLELLLPDWRPVGFFGGRIFATRPWAAQVPLAVQALVEHLRVHMAARLQAGAPGRWTEPDTAAAGR
jgi:DNA-binding transcriptional LysR family regulator